LSWYASDGPDNDIIISSRVRLARNLKDYTFPIIMKDDERKAVLENVREVLMSKSEPLIKDMLYVNISELTPVDREAMVERHMISSELARGREYSAAFVNKSESISVMVNEEDHLRIQCILPGLQLRECLELCSGIEDLIGQTVEYAFRSDYGYLTCCPTNVGTGMRASAMMHLPALTMTGYIGTLLETCGKIGVTVRGIHGEHSGASGNIYQVSNQISLGQSEEDIADNVNGIAVQIMNRERAVEAELLDKGRIRIEDMVYRSYGAFVNARMISTEESLKLLSDIRMGVNLGIVKDISLKCLNELMLSVQPATLQRITGRPLDPDERDIRRSEIIRQKLG
jgi:protein arginine kinase